MLDHASARFLGSLDQFDALARRLAAGTGCAVVLVDYRNHCDGIAASGYEGFSVR